MSKGRRIVKRMRDKAAGSFLLLRQIKGESKRSDYGSVPLTHLPHWVGKMRRERRVILMGRAHRRLACMTNERRNKIKRAQFFKTQGSEYARKQELLNKMTNWQRTQWSRAVAKRAKGKRPTDSKAMAHFVGLPHWKGRHDQVA